jgi:hypothetical protein
MGIFVIRRTAMKNRLEEVYTFLVDQTENPDVIHNRALNDRLQKLLELCEYLKGDEDENPVPYWFWGDENE